MSLWEDLVGWPGPGRRVCNEAVEGYYMVCLAANYQMCCNDHLTVSGDIDNE